MKRLQILITLLSILLTSYLYNNILAQDATDDFSFSVAVPTSSVVSGTIFPVEFSFSHQVMSNEKLEGQIALPLLADFETIGAPATSYSFTYLNGKRTAVKKYTYLLKAKYVGDFELKPASYTFDGQTLQSDSKNIRVIAQDFGKKESVFIKATISQEEAYIGQRIYIDYQLYLPAEDKYNTHHIMVEDEYLFFDATTIPLQNPNPLTVTINEVPYQIIPLKKIVLYPQATGDFFIKTADFKVITRIRNQLYLTSDSLHLKVIDYPSPIPSSFQGAVDISSLTLESSDTSSNESPQELKLSILSYGDISRSYLPRQADIAPVYKTNIASVNDWTLNAIDFSLPSQRVITYYQNAQTANQAFNPGITYFDTKAKQFKACNLNAIGLPLPPSWKNDTLLTPPLSRKDKQDTIAEQWHDLVIVIDVSSSMLTQDFVPDRIGYLKNMLLSLIQNKANDLRIGLVAFAAQAQTVSPLTNDRDSLMAIVEQLEVGMLEDGTALGNGTATAINLLKDSSAPYTSILLISDGVSNSGLMSSAVAAAVARRFGIMVNIISIGSEGFALTPVAKNSDGSYRFQKIATTPNNSSLWEMALLSAGNLTFISETQETLPDWPQLVLPPAAIVPLTDHPVFDVVKQQSPTSLALWLKVFELEELLVRN